MNAADKIEIDPIAYLRCQPPQIRSQRLLEILSSIPDRRRLFHDLNNQSARLAFASQASADNDCDDAVPIYEQQVYLLTHQADLIRALNDRSGFSNAPYKDLGSGTFMLALDGLSHDKQRKYAQSVFCQTQSQIHRLAFAAWKAASVLPLKQRDFDLAELAEQAALRFVGFLFGLPFKDVPLLEATMRKAYHGLNHQILGRHFVADPFALPEANMAMGMLLRRVNELLLDYQAGEQFEDIDDLKTIDGLEHFVPVIERMARDPQDWLGMDLSVMIVGLIAGTIGNAQASVCIAMDQLFRHPELLAAARNDARDDIDRLESLVFNLLAFEPPVPFLPRLAVSDIDLTGDGRTDIPKGANVVLCMGGMHCEREFPTSGRDETGVVFGGDARRAIHQCLGDHVARPLITRVVAEVLKLPGLIQTQDKDTGQPIGLERLWGFRCLSYPMAFRRSEVLIQQPLNVVMRVKQPIAEHAEALKKIIAYGAPRIESKLSEARHVHFAWFLLTENDSKLALFTSYDGDFDAYVEHFALAVGALFDQLFEHIDDAPPMPVNEHPKEFVETIRRYNQRPVGGYFYSDYPTVTTAQINNVLVDDPDEF